MSTIRAIVFFSFLLGSISLSAQINQDWVKEDHATIDSLFALDRNNPDEVYRFISGGFSEKQNLGFGWILCRLKKAGGYITLDADFYYYKDTIKSYEINSYLPHEKALRKEYRQLLSKVMLRNKDHYYEYKFGEENILKPLAAYKPVGKSAPMPQEILWYMSPKSGLDYGYRGGYAMTLLENRSRFIDLKKKLTPDRVITMMYSINPASRLTAIEYYLRNKEQFGGSFEMKEWIEVVFTEVPIITTMSGCFQVERDSREVVGWMLERDVDL